MGGRQWRYGTGAVLAVLMVWLALPWPLQAAEAVSGRDYLLVGGATDEPTPHRACTPQMLSGARQQAEVPAPPAGWSGEPQALDVFNVFAGEVRVQHGEREICGDMHDARTRDSRFRAGIGMVAVPPAGSHEPFLVSWQTPLKTRWVPTLRLGAPSPVQQNDTARLLVRAACIAVAIALALSALMAFLTTRDRSFLVYIACTTVLVLWQAVLGGLSGYPEPWLPVGEQGAKWLLSLTAASQALVLPALWRLNGGDRVLPRSRPAQLLVLWTLMALAGLVPWLRWEHLAWVAQGLQVSYLSGCGLALLVGIWARWRGDRWAQAGLAALAPMLVLIIADACGAEWLLEYRVEALQLAVTWLLMMAAYALNQRLGRLRQQRDELRQLAETDGLTGLPNRRAGLQQLARHLERVNREGGPLVIGFLDIDLFKDINDRHGHAVGDQVLVAVARALRTAVRSQDEVVRMGGEEFLLLMPGMPREAASARLDRLRQRITEAGQALQVAGLEVTASIGLAQWRPGEDDLAALLRRADHAMYVAKRAGRNRVFDGEELDPPGPA
ncbi:GGDEF domain-containing protein [Stenotrophomonas sp. GD03701]|uniref:sensor domain-containing diguanylate cyclase n=1 Tax=Stenotrophomonas TaxID=40323 RepID=UPI00066D5A26|nr:MULTISPECIES: diguanylate cyclase [Stenotrophomonas]MDH1386981.1 GGDEF domain-containing protein [Stenotrophomonas sp. GD03701]MDH1391515.1 GGDEF domain-containing protein [Stenotrophomonas sp. GD03702]MDQ7302735.1 GGDEF domain-containing protein [Stenotrophomonas sp. Sm0581]PJL03501.1 diguanylate cyclase [Stenotrophomonas maltophilia]PJL30099.1 diguanylate cyclase [Stenotrophomonas maltophilia]